MRRTFLSLAALLATAGSGLQCAYADASPGHPSVPNSVLERRPPTPPGPDVEIVDESLQRLPAYWHDGRRFVLGETNERYLIRIANPTSSRVEAVVSVDGLDAVDGRPGSLAKRGYIVPAYGEVVIDGWRTSLDAVAAFRFSSVRDSYAGRQGDDRNVGVIGVAFFRERPRPAVTWHPPPPPLRRMPAPPPAATDAESSAGVSSSRGAPATPSAPKAAGAAEASRSAPSPEPANRPGLGTQFGEAQESRVVETTFTRAAGGPMAVLEVRYDDREGLLSRGISIPPPRAWQDDENRLRDTARPFPVSRFAEPPP
ncbi:MAG TPA: hypothetical protein VKU41_12305 [Polyangiaceae bacterium]|nr:hypothetical protein [Polyangiaceae bacterium]